MEYVDTCEYLSYDAAMAEWENTNENNDQENDRNASNDVVDQTAPDQDGNDDDPDDELGRLAKINANLNANNLSEKAAQSKGKWIRRCYSVWVSGWFLFFRRLLTYVSSNLSRLLCIGQSAYLPHHIQRVRYITAIVRTQFVLCLGSFRLISTEYISIWFAHPYSMEFNDRQYWFTLLNVFMWFAFVSINDLIFLLIAAAQSER